MMSSDQLEKILWSIAFPGLGQLLNGHFLKGALFILLEFIINIQSKLNTIIISSFYGNTSLAISQANYEWLLFYPCLYTYAIWDAFKYAEGKQIPFSFLPFVFSAYIGTIGVIYSKNFSIFGYLLGPIWLPILSLILGAFIGLSIKNIIVKKRRNT